MVIDMDNSDSDQFQHGAYTEHLLRTKKLVGLLSLDGFLLNGIPSVM